MSNGFVYLRPLNLVYVRVTGPYAVSSRLAWCKVMDWLNESGLRRDVGCGYGLILDDPAATDDDKCRYDACVELRSEYSDKLSDEFQFRRLPGGAFVRQKYQGPIEKLRASVLQFQDDKISMSGLGLDRSRPIVEIYLDDPAKIPETERRVDICLPVRARGAEEDAAA